MDDRTASDGNQIGPNSLKKVLSYFVTWKWDWTDLIDTRLLLQISTIETDMSLIALVVVSRNEVSRFLRRLSLL